MKAIEIMNLLEKWAPMDLVDEWDNTGFQIGDPERQIEKILLSLDLDREVFKMAKDINAQMIITHHPIIFSPLKSLTKLNYKEKLIYDIIKEDIVVYNAHTNLDIAKGGVNDRLAEILGIKNTAPLKIVHNELETNEEKFGYGRVGKIRKMPLEKYLNIIKRGLNTQHLIVYGNIDRSVETVAVCGGSGSSFIKDAFMMGADIYITGDIKYHDAQYGNELGLTLIDAGHFHTEKIILPVVKDYIERSVEKPLDIEIYNQSSPPYAVF